MTEQCSSAELIGINKAFFGNPVLRDVSLALHGGEVLALVGANGAGKSTLMGILGGTVRADSGDIRIDGAAVSIRSPKEANEHGIAFVQQERSRLPDLSVAEQMCVTQFPTRLGLIDRKALYRRCDPILEELGAHFGARTAGTALGAAEIQMVEIGRALLADAELFVFDEATSSLTEPEKERLFAVIGQLKAKGRMVIYITHFLDEIFRVCSHAMVLRDGRVAGSDRVTALTQDAIARLMTGTVGATRSASRLRVPSGKVLLSCTSLSRPPRVRDVSLSLHAGEILGLWGLAGSGRSEVLHMLAGLDSPYGGVVKMGGSDSRRRARRGALRRATAVLPEERRKEGLLMQASIRENVSLGNLPSFKARAPLLVSLRRERRGAMMAGEQAGLRVRDYERPVATLSGGNQQKAVLARLFLRKTDIYLMDEPTRGLDIQAKADVQALLRELAEQGAGVLVVSSELQELRAISHRLLVLERGRLVAQFDCGDVSDDELMKLAMGSST